MAEVRNFIRAMAEEIGSQSHHISPKDGKGTEREMPSRVGDRSSFRQCALALWHGKHTASVCVAHCQEGGGRTGELRAWPRPAHSGKGRVSTGLQW